MQSISVRPLLAACLLLLLLPACSSGDAGGSGNDVGSAADLSGEAQSAAADFSSADALPPDDAGQDLARSDGSWDDDSTPVGPIPASVCGQPAMAECLETSPAPAASGGIQGFAVNNAIPLQCTAGGPGGWDFTVFLREFEGKQIFIFGEVHGSNEIGPASAALFRRLVEHYGVSILALEIGMDTTDDLDEYVQTGSEAALKAFGADQYSDVMFRKLLPEVARELVLEGHEISVVGVDVPQRLAWANEQLELLAAQAEDAAVQGLIVDSLPPPREIDSYGMFGIEDAYVAQAEEYYNHVVDNLDTICAAYEPAGCERVEYLAYSLWMGAVFASQKFMMGAMGGNDPELMAMMMEREQILLYNLKQAVGDSGERLYAHMGAAHGMKGGWNVAGQLDSHWAVTQGRVYTTSPAFGPGSSVFYGIMTQQVPPDPQVIAESLQNLPEERYFLSTDDPGLDCTASPFIDMQVPQLGNQYGVAWDAFFYFDKLTADSPGGWFYVPTAGREGFYRQQVQRLQMAERLLHRTQR